MCFFSHTYFYQEGATSCSFLLTLTDLSFSSDNFLRSSMNGVAVLQRLWNGCGAMQFSLYSLIYLLYFRDENFNDKLYGILSGCPSRKDFVLVWGSKRDLVPTYYHFRCSHKSRHNQHGAALMTDNKYPSKTTRNTSIPPKLFY